RIEADPGEMTRFTSSDVAVEMGDDTLRKVVGLYRAWDCESLQLWHEAPGGADDAPDQPAMSEVVETALLAVSLSCRVDEAQAAWFADTVGTTGCAFAKARLEGDGNSLRK